MMETVLNLLSILEVPEYLQSTHFYKKKAYRIIEAQEKNGFLIDKNLFGFWTINSAENLSIL